MSENKSVLRLLQYRSCLERFREIGFERVYSHNLGSEAGVSAEQVRKDFSRFRIKGNKKGGYLIAELMEALDRTFGKMQTQEVVLVGLGNIGMALSNYRGFGSKKIDIVAAFDMDPSKRKKRMILPVYPMEMLRDFVQERGIHIAILAVPESQAQTVCEHLVSSGIRGIMNFAPVNLKVPPEIKVNSINLSNELESLIYYVKSEYDGGGDLLHTISRIAPNGKKSD